MKKLGMTLKVIAGLAVMALATAGVALPVSAVTCPDGTTADSMAQCGLNQTNPDSEADENQLTNTIQNIINTVIFVVGIVAVVMVILGGIQYSTSQGDAGKVKKAKDTIMYGIIGLVVALLAFAIVNFVLANVFNTTT